MPKVGTYTAADRDNRKRDDFFFKYDVNITKEGLFTTTIPKEAADKLKAANIDIGRNRIGNPGYFQDKTLDGLQGQVNAIVAEYYSRELVDEKIVIRYQIRTTCSYCLDVNGIPVPNGQGRWTGMDEYKWENGTTPTHSSNREPFGLLMWVEANTRRVYKYRSGTEKVEYHRCDWNDFEDADKPNLDYLASIRSINTISGEKTQEIDYTEAVAGVFVGMLKAIFMMNEKIKAWTTPEAITRLAEQKLKLLG